MTDNVQDESGVQIRAKVQPTVLDEIDRICRITGLERGEVIEAAMQAFKAGGMKGLQSAIEQQAKDRIAALKNL